ncbi:MAG: 30S ribosomal protein S19 [Candidatus Micrarchaeota archaeon]|nr:30S ribosomal protein S19 [Candidatus Micrarchaeota archaeon]
MARTFFYRGKTVDQLQAMKPDEFTSLIKARGRRAIKRNGILYKRLLAKIDHMKKAGVTKPVRTHVREAVILPAWVGMSFAVYDGKQYQEMRIAPEMIGHRLGEYVYTVKRVVHSAPGIRATRGSKFLAVK